MLFVVIDITANGWKVESYLLFEDQQPGIEGEN